MIILRMPDEESPAREAFAQFRECINAKAKIDHGVDLHFMTPAEFGRCGDCSPQTRGRVPLFRGRCSFCGGYAEPIDAAAIERRALVRSISAFAMAG